MVEEEDEKNVDDDNNWRGLNVGYSTSMCLHIAKQPQSNPLLKHKTHHAFMRYFCFSIIFFRASFYDFIFSSASHTVPLYAFTIFYRWNVSSPYFCFYATLHFHLIHSLTLFFTDINVPLFVERKLFFRKIYFLFHFLMASQLNSCQQHFSCSYDLLSRGQADKIMILKRGLGLFVIWVKKFFYYIFVRLEFEEQKGTFHDLLEKKGCKNSWGSHPKMFKGLKGKDVKFLPPYRDIF